jgi:hypothetical protein
MTHRTHDQVSWSYASRGDAQWLDAGRDDPILSDDLTSQSGDIARRMLEATIERAFHKRVLKEFVRLSRDYPTLPLILTEKRLSIPCTAPDEFSMVIETKRGRCVVYLGAWRDEFASVTEAIELLDAAIAGEIRLRIDIDERGQHCSAEQRLINGDWIELPRCEDTDDDIPFVGVVRTIYLRNGYKLM